MSNVIVGGNVIANMTGGVFYTTPLARTVDGTRILQLSPAVVLTAYIIEELGLMTDPSDRDEWPLYSTHLPDNKNVEVNCGVVFDTVGVSDQRSMTGNWPEHPGVQLRIRARDNATGYLKIEEVASALDEVANGTIEIGVLEFEIQNVRRVSPVASLGVEPGKRRVNFTVNFLLTIRELTG